MSAVSSSSAAAPQHQKKKQSMLARTYLITYNAAQMAVWSAVLAQALKAVVSSKGSLSELNAVKLLGDNNNAVEKLIRLGLYGSAFEIVNAAIGLVRSPVGATATQVIIRALVFVLSLTSKTEGVRDKFPALALVLAWGLSEPIRYGFYLAGLLKGGDNTKIPKWLTWLRYSAFIPLYPIGVSGEMLCLYNALPHLAQTGDFSIRLPNAYNFSFDCPSVLKFVMATAYIPGWWNLYSYMLKQRKRILGGKKKAATEEAV